MIIATLTKSEMIAKDIYTFHFSPKPFVSYVAGQYIELIIPHNDSDNRGSNRWFTLSSSPTEHEYAITTKIERNSSSFKKNLLALKIGDKVKMNSPIGDFVLPKDNNINLTFIAGGIGITPFRSMIKWLKDSKLKRSIRLIYMVKEKEQAAFTKLFSSYDLRPELIISSKTNTNDLTKKALTSYTKESMVFLSVPEKII